MSNPFLTTPSTSTLQRDYLEKHRLERQVQRLQTQVQELTIKNERLVQKLEENIRKMSNQESLFQKQHNQWLEKLESLKPIQSESTFREEQTITETDYRPTIKKVIFQVSNDEHCHKWIQLCKESEDRVQQLETENLLLKQENETLLMNLKTEHS